MKNKLFIAVSILVVVIGAAALMFREKSVQESSEPFRVPARYLTQNYSPSHGPLDAPVQIVEFFDPECEACRAMHPIMKRLLNEYPNQIRVVYRYATFHANSDWASALLEEARAAGKFDEALDLFFEHQPEWGSHANPQPQLLPGYLKPLGLSEKAMERETVIAKHEAVIEQDQADGAALAVKQTPSYFVNGRPLFSIGYDALKSMIDAELALKK